MAEPIISVSGLRGIVGESLTPEVAMRYAAAFAAIALPGEILVGRDSRPSGRMLSLAIHAGLQAVGRTTIDAGIVATPTVGVLLRHCKAAGAIQITASHNPLPYNGLKLFSAEGRVIPAATGPRSPGSLSERPSPPGCRTIAWATVCAATTRSPPICWPFWLRSTPSGSASADSAWFLDSNHGAGAILGRRLLHELACRLTVLGEEPNGQFAHPAEPTAENLAGVLQAVTDAGRGRRLLPGPRRRPAGRHRPVGPLPWRGVYAGHVHRPRIAAAKGPDCHELLEQPDVGGPGRALRRAVLPLGRGRGERGGLPCSPTRPIFGGEGNGGPIDPRVGYVRDSFVGMALLLDAMAARQMRIGQLADELPRYEIVKTKVAFPPEKFPAAFDALEQRFPDAATDGLDGLRFDWPGRWLLVRGSNTEPIVRAIAEAPTAAEAASLCEAAAKVLDHCDSFAGNGDWLRGVSRGSTSRKRCRHGARPLFRSVRGV